MGARRANGQHQPSPRAVIFFQEGEKINAESRNAANAIPEPRAMALPHFRRPGRCAICPGQRRPTRHDLQRRREANRENRHSTFMSFNPWTHSICEKCWNEQHPDKPIAIPPQIELIEICCWCSDYHNSGIYVRGDPQKTPCFGSSGPIHNRPGGRKEIE
jgi:hypothetical protein